MVVGAWPMVLEAWARLNPASPHQVQERHTVLKMRIKVGPMDGKVLLDCTFRPLHLRGEAEGQVLPRVLLLSPAASVSVYVGEPISCARAAPRFKLHNFVSQTQHVNFRTVGEPE